MSKEQEYVPENEKGKYVDTRLGKIAFVDSRVEQKVRSALEEARQAVISHPNVVGDRIHRVVLASGLIGADFPSNLNSEDMLRMGLSIADGVHLIQQSPVPSGSDNFTRFYLYSIGKEEDANGQRWQMHDELQWTEEPAWFFPRLPRSALRIRGRSSKSKLPLGSSEDVGTGSGKSEVETYSEVIVFRDKILSSLPNIE